MLKPLKRLSLVAQSAAILRAHIGSRSSGDALPSERALCAQLGISRMTLRAALARLSDEGLIRRAKGKRHSIVATQPGRGPATSRDVIILSPLPLHSLDPRILFWIEELRDALAKEGYKLEFLRRQTYYSKHPAHALENLVAQLRPAAWLLYLSTREMQEWFSERGLPAIIPGSRYPEVRLPSVDVDYRATCQHAAGQMMARGHTRLVLLNPRSTAGGDLESEASFRQASARVESIVAQHDGTVSSICSQLDRLLSQAKPATAFLVSRPTHALTALGHLVRRGIRFPKDAVLIARDHDSFLDHAVPSLARYQADPVLFAHKLSRLVLEIASGGDARARDYRVIPRLIAGETLGDPGHG
jgi:DNA-binding LacI/PurR family transcriptional regulator